MYYQSCGSEVLREACFYHKCGRPVSSQATEVRATPDAWEYRVLFVDLTKEGKPTRFDGFCGREALWKHFEPRILAELNRWAEQGWELGEQELSGRLLDFTYTHHHGKTAVNFLFAVIGLGSVIDNTITLVRGARLHIRRRRSAT